MLTHLRGAANPVIIIGLTIRFCGRLVHDLFPELLLNLKKGLFCIGVPIHSSTLNVVEKIVEIDRVGEGIVSFIGIRGSVCVLNIKI